MKKLSKYINESLAPNYFISRCVLCDIEMSDYLLETSPVMELTKSKNDRVQYLLENGSLDEVYVIWNNTKRETQEELTVGSFISLSSGNIAITLEQPLQLPDEEVRKFSDVDSTLNSSSSVNFYVTTDGINYPDGYVYIDEFDKLKTLKKGMIA